MNIDQLSQYLFNFQRTDEARGRRPTHVFMCRDSFYEFVMDLRRSYYQQLSEDEFKLGFVMFQGVKVCSCNEFSKNEIKTGIML